MDDSVREAASDCPCVGSMGLHQNNISRSQCEDQSNGSFLGGSFNQFKNRSVIDVFREMRDRYFGKPKISALSKQPLRRLESDSEKEAEDEGSENIDTLPVYCKLMILSFLETWDVCSVSSLNSHWRGVANDQILWRELLIRDMCKWESMTNKSHPLISQVWNNEIMKDSMYGINFQDLSNTKTVTNVGSMPEHRNEIIDKGNPPDIHANKGVNFKALYIHSAFQRMQDDSQVATANFGIPGFIKSLWHGSDTPVQGEIIMTGPGMDSPRTSKIFRALMWDSGFLDTKGLLAGNRDGIGSGVQLIFKEKIPFNLVALYSGNNRVRESRIGIQRLLHSNVVEALANSDMNDNENNPGIGDTNAGHDAQHKFVLYDAVRLYIAERRGKYKLVYVVDATANQRWEEISCNKLELAAILSGTEFDSNINALITPPAEQQEMELEQIASEDEESSNAVTHSNITNAEKRPLLVLSCIADSRVPRFSCMQITAMLDLPIVNDRQWRVQDVVVSTMHGVELGLEWLLRQS